MIDKNMLRVSIKGEPKWLAKEELESYVQALDPIPKPDQSSENTMQVDGVKAVVAAGCSRRCLNELREEGDFYIPPQNINPSDLVEVIGSAENVKRFILNCKVDTDIIPLSVTQLWWLRKQHHTISRILLKHGSALQFTTRSIILHSSSSQLLSTCKHLLLQVLIDIVDCKFRYPYWDTNGERLLQEAHQVGAFAVWHDGVLEVQGGRDSVHALLVSHSSILSSPCKLINVHPHDDKDFICGKKDGKLMRIMREHQVQIHLKDVGEPPVLLQIATTGHGFERVWRASQRVDDELPTVLIAHIPEQQHRRLIGQAGKNIQRIMKRHAVYIKFYNEEEARKEFGGWREWHKPQGVHCDLNVVIKTPSKNGEACRKSYEDVLLECGLTEEPGGVLERNVVDVKSMLGCKLERNQVIEFVDNQWTIARYEPLYGVRCDSYKLTVEPLRVVDTKTNDLEVFNVFPSYLLPSNTTTTSKTLVSAVEETDEMITTDADTGKLGVIGEHVTSTREIDAEIEALMQNLGLAAGGRRKSLSVFEL